MKFRAKLWITDNADDDKFFGKGPYDLLKRVHEYGSLNKAAKSMHMSYSKAFNIIKRSEKILGIPLIISEIGGAKGGGSVVTEEAAELIRIYEDAEKELNKTLERLSRRYQDWEEEAYYEE